MSHQKAQEQQIDFSIISKQNPNQNPFDSSLESILTQKQQKSSSKNKNTGKTGIENFDSLPDKKDTIVNGSFLKDLQKLEQQLSYQSKSFNVYDPQFEDSNIVNPIQVQNKINYSQSNQNQVQERFIHFTNQSEVNFNYLIIDFTSIENNLPKATLTFLQRLKIERNAKIKSNQLKLIQSQQPIRITSTQSAERINFITHKNHNLTNLRRVSASHLSQFNESRWQRNKFRSRLISQQGQSFIQNQDILYDKKKSQKNYHDIMQQYFKQYLKPKNKIKIDSFKKKTIRQKLNLFTSKEKNILKKIQTEQEQLKALKFKAIKHKKMNLKQKS